MDLCDYPPEVQKFITELLKRRVITRESLDDKMLINFLYTQRYDEAYIDSIMKDRRLMEE